MQKDMQKDMQKIKLTAQQSKKSTLPLKVTMLGCGTSCGVPRIDGYFGNCDPANEKNHRMRSSIFIEAPTESMLVDCGTDVRRQLLDNKINDFDSLFVTHNHADHVNGIDDLRWIKREKIRCLTDKDTFKGLNRAFPYALDKEKAGFYKRPIFDFEDAIGGFDFSSSKARVYVLDHGASTSLGFTLGGLAYFCDVVNVTSEQLASLSGISVWIVDCLGHKAHMSHAHLARVLSWVDIVKPQLTILTHMGLDMDYDSLLMDLPKGVIPGFDGLKLSIDNEFINFNCNE